MTPDIAAAPNANAEPCCGAIRNSVLLGFLLLCGAGIFFFAGFSLSSGNLTLKTEPPGASVFLNGHLAGATPVSLHGLERGAYSLRLEKDGYTPLSRSITLANGEMAMDEKLSRVGTGRLKVEVLPVGSEVLLDGELLGHTPLIRDDVPTGVHELLVRKTNFNPYAQSIEVDGLHPLEFKDFGLEDKILKMLHDNIDKEKQRVSHYLDLGHYLFVNNQLEESAEVYAHAQRVAASPLDLTATLDANERILETRLRGEDVRRLQDELRKCYNWPGKDVAKFRIIVDRQLEKVANENIGEWVWVHERANGLQQDQKLAPAEDLFRRYIAAAPRHNPNLAQAYIELITVRLKMKNLVGVKESYSQFLDLCGNQPILARQAANAIYSGSGTFQGEAHKEVLGMAEALLRRAVDGSRQEAELAALCKFELGNVLTLQGRGELAVPFYRDSIEGTKDASTKELRSEKLVDNLKSLKNFSEVRPILNALAKSPHSDIANKAVADIKEVDVMERGQKK